MLEMVLAFRQLGPVQRALLLFPLGLILGSFSTVVYHRLRHGQSIVSPRSHCPECGHTLGLLDLIPVVSFIWLRGRCRHCTAPISWEYPLQELACGLVTATGGWLVGWSGGLAGALLWVAGISFTSSRKRSSLSRREAGATLVEVLIAVGILAVLILPMINFSLHVNAGTAFERQLAVSVATGTIEELGNMAYRTDEDTWPPATYVGTLTVGRYRFRREWVVTDYNPPDIGQWPAESDRLKQASVTVTCLNCTRTMPPVRMVALLAKLEP